ncbi:MAG: ferrochelatase [Candidatus Acidiferrales bacterium]
MSERKRVGVVLFQLGGPDSPDAIEPFLYNLFCDPDIINFPGAWLARKPLAWWIAHRRARAVADHYAAIGGQSPIRLLTERQARALEHALASRCDAQKDRSCDAKCFVAMRYWHPLTREAVAAVRATPLDDLVLLPMYPQYSFATTVSSMKEWSRLYRPSSAPHPPTVHAIKDFYTHPLYIQALTERITATLRHFADPTGIHFVFSAHGLPISLVERGDPYPRQVEETVRLVLARGAWPYEHTLCYQSRVGRQRWLAPSLDSTIERLAKEGKKKLLLIPLSFVTEHIETLHEINIEAREEALRLGVEQFQMMPALGDSPTFIAALADLVLRAAGVDSFQNGSKSA